VDLEVAVVFHSESAESVREYLATDANALVLAMDPADSIKPANSKDDVRSTRGST
jgi:hypothetical protein